LADVDAVSFHCNTNYLATGSADKSVRLWEVQRGPCVRLLLGHTGVVNTVCCSPCGQYIASAGEDKTIVIWDIPTGKPARVLRGHTSSIWSVDYSACGKILSSGSADGTVKIWDSDLTKAEPAESLLTSHDALQGAKAGRNTLTITNVAFTRRNLLLAAAI
jgi:transcription initiation factor TFIID subunit 5